MGLFDSITISYKLPAPKNPGELKRFDFNSLDYQTKDLDCLMDNYSINEKGIFFYEGVRKNFTGFILFYTGIYKDKNKFDYWIEYSAQIVKGKVKNIVLIRFSKTNNFERKKKDKEFQEILEKEKIRADKWYYKYFYSYYRRFIRYSFRKIRMIVEKINLYKIENSLIPW